MTIPNPEKPLIQERGETALPEFPMSGRVRLPVWTGTKIISHIVLLLMGAFFVLPILWLLTASFDTGATWKLEIPDFTLANFAKATRPDYRLALLNSVIISAVATVVATVAAFFAAYSFSRQFIPWKGPLLLVVLLLSGVPVSILIVPTYKMFAFFGWLSMFPAALMLGVTALPFEIYLIKNSIDSIPLDLEEAAVIEKAGTLDIVRRVVVPLSFPGIVSAAIFGFVNAWGSFLIPQVLITDAAEQPGPVRMYGFINSVGIDYGAIAAFSLLYSMPVVLLYFLVSSAFGKGFMLGGAVR